MTSRRNFLTSGGAMLTAIVAGCSALSSDTPDSESDLDEGSLPDWTSRIPETALNPSINLGHIDVIAARDSLSESQYEALELAQFEQSLGVPADAMSEFVSVSYPDAGQERGAPTDSVVIVGDIDTQSVQETIAPESATEEYNGYTVFSETLYTGSAAASDEQLIVAASPEEYIDATESSANALADTDAQAGTVLRPVGSDIVTGSIPAEEINTTADSPTLDPAPLRAGFTTSAGDGDTGIYDVAYLFDSADQAESALETQKRGLANSIESADDPTVRQARSSGELVLMTLETAEIGL